MSGDDRHEVEEMIALCEQAAKKGVTLLLSRPAGDVGAYCCSSTDPMVIAAIAQPEVRNLSYCKSDTPHST